MPLADMMAELRGSVPKIPFSYTKTLINRAWRHVRESNLWSFNMFESSWISPPLLTTGTVTCTQGLAAIQFDATAIASLNAAQTAPPYSLITQRQFRVAIGGIYSIIQYNPITGAATLDRPFAETGGAGIAFQIYQLLYAAPFADHRAWLSVRNPDLRIDLGLDMTRADIDMRDPQRSWYQFPTEVIPYGADTRGAGTANASATLGYPLFELWGQPVAPFVYQCYGVRNGVDLAAPTDTLPFIIPEDLLMPKARGYAYEWCEANKDITPRATGPDWRFLMGKADADFKKLLSLYRKQDKEFVNNWISTHIPNQGGDRYGYYNTRAGFAGTLSPP
jgi:hypothetical protein